MTRLVAVVAGEVLGRIESNRDGLLSFRYEPAWLEREYAIQLSTSMPLGEFVYKQAHIAPYLWNLLPENEYVLRDLAVQYGLKGVNPFKLLLTVGEDAPGAAQFVPEERLADYLGAGEPVIAWISIDQVEQRMGLLRQNAAALRLPQDVGRISLAGAQAKTSFYWDGERWGVPSGRTPNTHILKPAIPGLAGIIENEHLCMTIAARYGLPTASSSVLGLSEPVIVVKRFDRLPPLTSGGTMRRVHQEDFCQALSLMPIRKYQEEGGPGIRQCVELLRRVSSTPVENVETFLKANMFNWYIGGMDAHAKNYSLLIGAGDVRLAPLYDLSSHLQYADHRIKQRLSMKIGEHYEVGRIGLDDWRAVARDCKLEEDQVITWLVQMGQALPDHVRDAARHALSEGLNKRYVAPLRDQLIDHIRERVGTISN